MNLKTVLANREEKTSAEPRPCFAAAGWGSRRRSAAAPGSGAVSGLGPGGRARAPSEGQRGAGRAGGGVPVPPGRCWRQPGGGFSGEPQCAWRPPRPPTKARSRLCRAAAAVPSTLLPLPPSERGRSPASRRGSRPARCRGPRRCGSRRVPEGPGGSRARDPRSRRGAKRVFSI